MEGACAGGIGVLQAENRAWRGESGRVECPELNGEHKSYRKIEAGFKWSEFS